MTTPDLPAAASLVSKARTPETPRAREDRLIEAGEVAEMLAVPERWVREATRAGKLPCVQIGRYVRYDRADVLAWVDEQKRGGAALQRRRPVRDGGTKSP